MSERTQMLIRKMQDAVSVGAQEKRESQKYKALGKDLWDKLLKKLSSITKHPVEELRRANGNKIDDILDEVSDKNPGRAKQADQIFDAIKDVSRAVNGTGIDAVPKIQWCLKRYSRLV